MIYEFIAYGGQCEISEGVCTDELDIDLENIQGTLENLKCKMIESKCVVSFDIRNFELEDNGKVSLKLLQDQSLSSEISILIQQSSSIPGQTSSISDRVSCEKDYLFRGPIPSTFSFLVTPSLFETDSSIWEDEKSGYHVTVQESPIKGSQASISE